MFTCYTTYTLIHLHQTLDVCDVKKLPPVALSACVCDTFTMHDYRTCGRSNSKGYRHCATRQRLDKIRSNNKTNCVIIIRMQYVLLIYQLRFLKFLVSSTGTCQTWRTDRTWHIHVHSASLYIQDDTTVPLTCPPLQQATHSYYYEHRIYQSQPQCLTLYTTSGT